jgi:integrase
VHLAAGTGLRQGEAFGLTLDRVDFLRRRVRVDRQLVQVGSGAPAFGPPKTAASVRTVPMADVTLQALARHLEAYPVDGPGALVFTRADGGALRRNRFGEVWSKARASAGLGADRTFHDLRHFYASLLIHHGESVKVVQARLGHASASETLDTYSHLWPDSEDRTRDAVAAAWALEDRRPADPQHGVAK